MAWLARSDANAAPRKWKRGVAGPGRGRAYALPLPQIRTCPIKASGSSTGGLAASPATGRRRLSTLSSEVTVTRNEAAKCSPWCPPLGPPVGSALPSPGSAEVRSPASTVLWRCATPCAPLAALRCLRLAIPCGAPVVSLPAVQDARPRAWGSSSGPHNRKVAAGRQSGPPRFPCNPLSLCPVLRPRQDRTHQAITVQRHGPRYVHGEGSHDLSSFRGSIARPWDWLFTLRPVRCRTRRKTRFRLLAKRCRAGISTPQGCYERFRIVIVLLSRAYLAQGHSRFRECPPLPTPPLPTRGCFAQRVTTPTWPAYCLSVSVYSPAAPAAAY